MRIKRQARLLYYIKISHNGNGLVSNFDFIAFLVSRLQEGLPLKGL